jgi:hypothetical protein
MNRALKMAAEDLNVSIPEFTVAGVPHGTFFAHHWYVASDDHVDAEQLRVKIDQYLKELNDDYAVERKSALKEVLLDVLPEDRFLDFMRSKGKVGGQHKFPRVLKGQMLQDWQLFVSEMSDVRRET